MLENRVRDVTTSTGTGSVALANTPPTGCFSFSGASIPSSSTVRYEINDGAGTWEIWTGVFTTGPDTLTKVTLEASSTGAQINWAAGSKSVFIVPSARDLVYQLPTLIGTTAGTANAQTLTPATRLLAYRGGYFFRATIGGGLTNTGATTFAISGLATRSVKRYGPGGKIALSGGELVAGQTYEFFDDGTDIIVLNPSIALVPGAGILTRVSSTSIKFAPKNGDWVMIAGVLYPIPSAGITAANTSVYVNGVAGQNLAANTVYLVTLFDNAGTLTIDFKTTTTHGPSTTAGNLGTEIWNSTDSRSVIGMVRTNGSSQFDDSSGARNVASWFNRQFKDFVSSNAASASTTSTSYANISGIACASLSWGDAVLVGITGNAYTTSSGQAAFASVGDGGTTGLFDAGSAAVNVSSNVGALFAYPASEGYHQWLLLGKSTNGGVGAVFQHSITGGVWA